MGADRSELIGFLKKGFKDCNVVVMPDFFMDRLINLECDLSQFSASIGNKVLNKGGSIDQISQVDQCGGNAMNVASALTALGIKVIPIICTTQFGFEQINHHFHEYSIDFSHIKIQEKASITTALEFDAPEGKTNVMLRDVGSLANFGPSNLDEADYALIAEANYVCLFNWVGTKNFGSELAQVIFHHMKTKGKGKTYFATADPTPNEEKIPDLITKVLKSADVDILSLNENEAFSFASFFDANLIKERAILNFDELALKSARVLAKHLRARIDLHTTKFSATITQKQEVFVPAFRVNVLRATGAGDAWDAGNIIGDFNALSDEGRLTFANAVSAFYLSDKNGLHPTRQQLLNFIKTTENLTL